GDYTRARGRGGGAAAPAGGNPLRGAGVPGDVLRCAYCAPEQHRPATEARAAGDAPGTSVVTEIDLPADAPVRLTADEVRDRLSGHVCRCGAYPNGAGAGQDVVV
ncbi:oxidoreductase, partial [Streptomyces sp. NPDC059095]